MRDLVGAVPAGAGLEQAVERARAGAVVLTPTTRAARLVIGEVGEAEQRAGNSVWASPQVMPLAAWVESSFANALLSGKTPLLPLSAGQETRLWERVLSSSRRGMTAAAGQAWALAHQYGIALDSVAMSATEETRSFFTWARDFRQQLADNHWVSRAQLPDELAALLPSLTVSAEIVLYGFDELTPQEQRLLQALGAHGCAVERIVTAQGELSSTRLFQADDVESELRVTARWARAQLERDPQTQIGVVVLGLAESRLLVEQIFTEVLEPETFYGGRTQPAFEISLGSPLAAQPMMRTALDLLELCAGEADWGVASVLLRSPYVGGAATEWSRRAECEVRLRKQLKPRVTMPRLLDAMETLDAPPLLDANLRAVLALLRTAHAEASFCEWRRLAESILKQMGWPGERALGSVEYQAAERWRKLLGEVAALDLVGGPVRFREFVAELRRAAQAAIFHPESLGAPVQVMDAREASGAVFDALWVCGLTDEALPSAPRPNALLPLSVQRAAGVPGTDATATHVQGERTLRRLLASAAPVVLSCARREEDRELRCSPLLAGAQEALLSELSLSAEDGMLRSFPRPSLLEAEPERKAPRAVPSELRGVTRLLELQSTCPFRAFAEQRLRASVLEAPAEGVTPIERGDLVETVLKYAWDELKDSAALASADLDAIIGRALDRTLHEFPNRPRDAWSRKHLELERERLAAVAREWLEMEKKRAPFTVVAHQKKLTMVLAGQSMSGRADRIDHVDQGLVVIDYKSGSSKYGPGQWMPPRLERPQLPFYAAQLMSDGEHVAGVAFGRVERGKARFAGIAEDAGIFGARSGSVDRYCNGDYAAHLKSWRPALEDLQSAFLDGEASVDPLRWPGKGNSTCQDCKLYRLCRVRELAPLATDDAEDSEEAADE